MTIKVSRRASQLMKVLVENYLKHGQPVGSNTLAKLSEMSVSAATIRNVMGELEQQGLLVSPHTSAGRVPTHQGYRLFVDHLLTVKNVEQQQKAEIQAKIHSHQSSQTILSSTSNLLSELTHMAGLVKVPSRKFTRIKHIEFMPLTEKRILVILVLNQDEVQNRIIHTDHAYRASELTQATNYINNYLVGQDLATARRTLVDRMKLEKQRLDSLMQLAIELADKGLAGHGCEEGYHLSGDQNLLNIAQEGGDLSTLKAIFAAFQQKQDVLALLDKALLAEGVQIYIGEECATDGLANCSVVTAPYHFDGEPVGVLAVVGPTRMRYDKIIPIVDITAKIVTSALNQSD